MTSRCKSIVVMAGVGLVVGILRQQTTLALVSLSMLVWILIVGILFSLQVEYCWRNLIVKRTLNGQDATNRNVLWVGREYEMRLILSTARGVIPAISIARDLIPEPVSVPQASNPLAERQVAVQLIQGRRQIEIAYSCIPLAAGVARFFGVHFQFQDPQGLYLLERVYHQPRQFRILPKYAKVGDPQPRIKRTNALPQHGIHQLRRAGFGGELLELREYQPGDPPKSIAWKVSARRDQLMTRQYESEVPIRMTILIDAGVQVYVGLPGARLIDQAVYLAASITKAAVSAGDAVGLIICGSSKTERLRPGHGDRAFYQILDKLSDHARPPETPPGRFSKEAIELASNLCSERFPELMNPLINETINSWLTFRPQQRRRRIQQMQMANVLADLYELSPDEACELIYDEEKLAIISRRFLNDCDRAWIPPVVDLGLHPFDQGTRKARLLPLASELGALIARAHDNEVFVVMANLLDNRLSDPYAEFDALLPAIKTASARHHRVVVVAGSTTNRQPEKQIQAHRPTSSADVLEQAEQVRISRLANHFSRRLRSAGAVFTVSASPDVVPLVMAEAELAGSGRHRSRRARK